MASITYWNRVEPRPRTESLSLVLGARIRDPLWFLTRQLQFGEFQGEDAASPAYVQFSAGFSALHGWRPGEGDFQMYNGLTPLDEVILGEGFTPDYAISVELGQQLETFIGNEVTDQIERDGLIRHIRQQYPLPEPGEIEGADRDTALMNFLRVFGGKALHGYPLLSDYLESEPALPEGLEIPVPHQEAVRHALANLKLWTESTYGQLAVKDAVSWLPERLEYDVEVSGQTPTGNNVRLKAHPGQNGEFDWYDFDETWVSEPVSGVDGIDITTRSLLPIHVRFPGIPNARWWQFEGGGVNFSDIKLDPADTAKMVLIDFMLVHSNDWFVVPFTQPLGSLCRINALLVHDVFGETTVIDAALSESSNATARWSMFTLTTSTQGKWADYFILPPGIGSAGIDGEVIEEVRFLRDEMFNSAFGIEQVTENGIGDSWPGHERSTAKPPNAEKNETESPLKYLIQSWVPEYWIPFVPVREGIGLRAVNFERAALQRPIGNGNFEPIEPIGRILNPNRVGPGGTYRIKEEEIPRAGVRVTRKIRRSRWIDGSTHIWITRTVRPGIGEGSSGLRFDLAIAKDEPNTGES